MYGRPPYRPRPARLPTTSLLARDFDDVIAAIALYRPGPLEAEMIGPFITLFVATNVLVTVLAVLGILGLWRLSKKPPAPTATPQDRTDR